MIATRTYAQVLAVFIDPAHRDPFDAAVSSSTFAQELDLSEVTVMEESMLRPELLGRRADQAMQMTRKLLRRRIASAVTLEAVDQLLNDLRAARLARRTQQATSTPPGLPDGAGSSGSGPRLY